MCKMLKWLFQRQHFPEQNTIFLSPYFHLSHLDFPRENRGNKLGIRGAQYKKDNPHKFD